MATELTLTHRNGLRKTAYVGWSWTSFLFGGFPALFRGDMLGFFIYLALAIIVVLLTAASPVFGLLYLVLWFMWAITYNRWHTRRLIEKGYEITGAAIPLDMARARVQG